MIAFTTNMLGAFDGGHVAVLMEVDGHDLGPATIVACDVKDGTVRTVTVNAEGDDMVLVPSRPGFDVDTFEERNAHPSARGVPFRLLCVDD